MKIILYQRLRIIFEYKYLIYLCFQNVNINYIVLYTILSEDSKGRLANFLQYSYNPYTGESLTPNLTQITFL